MEHNALEIEFFQAFLLRYFFFIVYYLHFFWRCVYMQSDK